MPGFGRFRIWLQIWVTIAYKALLEVNTKDLLIKIAPNRNKKTRPKQMNMELDRFFRIETSSVSFSIWEC